MFPVRRKAILIGDPGPKKHLLPGVAHDIDNMYGYLMSPRGGGWRQDEIIVLWARTKAEILSVVRSVEGDYLYVYYSGHGSSRLVQTWQGNGWVFETNRRLELRNGAYIEDVELINERTPRQLVVCDCCRDRPGAKIGGIPETLESIPYTQEEVNVARNWFDWYIHSSPGGRRIVHSTQDGKTAVDSEDGGVFTLTLLEGSLYWQGKSDHAAVWVEALVVYAVEVLGDSQVPEIVYETGDLAVPFALDTPWPWAGTAPGCVSSGDERAMQFQEVSQLQPVNGWLMLGVAALGLWLWGRR